MRWMLVGLVIGAASRAQAQAPGQLPPPAPASTVMDERWAVGAMLGSETLTASPAGAAHVTFGTLELAGRFRIRPAWEVALALTGGGSTVGQFQTGGLYIDGRYRFVPDQPWNGFVLLGLGVVSVNASNASAPENKGRGSLRIGGGIERRFGRLAIDAELHLIAIGKNKDVIDRADSSTSYELAKFGVTGGALSVGASFYF